MIKGAIIGMQMIKIVNGQKKNDKDGLEESKELATTILI
jgi:hypothetical protein